MYRRAWKQLERLWGSLADNLFFQSAGAAEQESGRQASSWPLTVTWLQLSVVRVMSIPSMLWRRERRITDRENGAEKNEQVMKFRSAIAERTWLWRLLQIHWHLWPRSPSFRKRKTQEEFPRRLLLWVHARYNRRDCLLSSGECWNLSGRAWCRGRRSAETISRCSRVRRCCLCDEVSLIDAERKCRKYRYMDGTLAQRRANLEEKIPDIKKTLDMVEFIRDRRVSLIHCIENIVV